MKMGKAAKRTKKGIAGIVATVIMFAILFTVGTSYFIFVNANNSQYVQNLVSASSKLQGSLGENLQITTLLASNGDLAFYVNNTSGLTINMTVVYVLGASGGMLKCDGVGLPVSASCSNTVPTLWATVNAGKGSPSTGTYDTGYLYVSGTDTVKVLTQRGNTYSATYPNNAVNQAVQAQTSQALSINLATYKWVQLLPQATSIAQKAYTSNCSNGSNGNCAKAFGSSVSSADMLVYALGWYNSNPPATPTDTLGDSFSLAASQSVTTNLINPIMVQDAYASNCNSNSCGTSFGSSVTQGDTLAFGLGWYTNPVPSTPTDSLGDSYSLAAHQSVGATGSPSLVQKAFTNNCNSSSCGKAFGSAVAANDVLAVAIDWNNAAPPSTPTDTLGNTYTLAAQVALPGTASQYTQANPKQCNNQASCNAGKLSSAQQGDVVVLALGWYNHADPTSVTDTFSDSFTQGVEKTVTVSGTTYYSAIYYAICGTCNNDDIITANFGSSTNAVATAYELSGVTTTGAQASTGSATSGATTASVTSFTPASGSYVVANVETSGAATFASVPPYAIPGGPGPCNGGPADGCSESASISAATTAQMTLTNSLGFAEVAMSFPPTQNGYNSYIWDATTSSSGADTITAAFSYNVQGSVSVYEIAQATTSGAQTSTGTSTSGPTTSTVTSFTPASNSFVIGATEVGAGGPGFGSGPGFTIIQGGGGGCNGNQGCSEYEAGLGSATTVSMNLGAGENTWVEAAISFPPAAMTFYSYIWYATAASSGADTVTASFATTAIGSVSIYEMSGMVTAGLLTSTGTSGGGSTTASVSSFAVNSNSILIANTETTRTSFTAGASYTLDGTCSSVYGCSEYQTGVSGSRSASMTLNPSAPWVEVAVAFSPLQWTFYSYIWDALAASAGSDTITATFSGPVAASAAVYDLSGVNQNAILSSTGSSASGSTTVSVASFTPYQNSIVIGDAEAGLAPSYTAGTGFSLAGSCTSVNGCAESQTGVSSSVTAPMTLNPGEPWVESAIAIGAQINPQSGFLVGGYPSMGVPDQNNIAWHANFTNTDAGHRAVTLWPQSEISITGIQSGGPKHYDYFIISSVNQGVTGIVAYPANPASFITVPYGQTVQLWFAANAPLTASYSAIDFDNSLPYQALFSLTGVYSDGTLYGETIPYPTGIITEADAQESLSAGPTGTQVTVTCTACGYKLSSNAMIGWIDHSGKMTVLTTFTTTSNGGIPANTKFTVPSAPAGYYTIIVSDYVNTEFITFQHT